MSVAGASNFLPLEAAWRGPFFIQGRPRPRSGDEPQAQHQTRGRRLLPRAGRAARQGPLLRPDATPPRRPASIIDQRRARAPAMARRGSDRQAVIVADSRRRPDGAIADAGAADLPGRRRRRQREELDARARRRSRRSILQLSPVPVPRHATSSCRDGAIRRRCVGAVRTVGAAAGSEPAARARRARSTGSSARRPTGRAR